ncbi:MAG TPA: TonB-dependent receptor plug domain-containing protein, partial [Gammaproteobacteria bacterium]
MKKNKKQFILQRPQRLLWAMVLCFTAPLTSAQLSSNIDISENKTLVPSEIALRELMQLLDEETELATRTRMNVDFVPDVMTVLHGGDLEARGVQTVHDALGLVPGIELSRTNDGRPQVLVRGLGPSFFSGKIKFLLNDTPFNGALGGASTLLILPIEQVDRIEVIRGPGSAIYGEYASVGVVNVITRKARAEAYLRSTDLERRTLGASVSHEFHPRLKFDFSFSDVNVAGGDIEVDNDIMRDTPISNAPGPINNREEHQSYLFNAYAGDYHFAWQSVAEGLGDFFGVNNALPSPGQRVVSILRTQSFELSRPWRVGNNWDANAKLGYFQFSLETSPREL